MTTEVSEERRSGASGGVQSLHRALDLLEIVSQGGGHMAIGEIAATTSIPLPTIHRLLKTLVERGYMRQLPNRRYALGFQLLPLVRSASGLLGANTGPALARLVAELGETANLAVLADDRAEYIAQVPSPHSMRMFTEVGRRVELHCTGVGKALLSKLDPRDVSAMASRGGLARHTPNTISTAATLEAEVARIREAGFAIDDEEQELGVRCVAMPLPGDLFSPMAVSVSGPLGRVTDRFVERAVPLLASVARELSDQFTASARAPRLPVDTDDGHP
jgi:IclR family transcriptional regulator, acetate operon repressor